MCPYQAQRCRRVLFLVSRLLPSPCCRSLKRLDQQRMRRSCSTTGVLDHSAFCLTVSTGCMSTIQVITHKFPSRGCLFCFFCFFSIHSFRCNLLYMLFYFFRLQSIVGKFKLNINNRVSRPRYQCLVCLAQILLRASHAFLRRCSISLRFFFFRRVATILRDVHER